MKELDDPIAISNKIQDYKLKESRINTKKQEMWGKFRKSENTTTVTGVLENLSNGLVFSGKF